MNDTFSKQTTSPRPADRMPVCPYRTMQPHLLPVINRDLDLSLNESQHTRLMAHFRTIERRDPNVAELRLLDHLDRAGRERLAQIAVGELRTTDSILMETWADMMDKYHALCPTRTPPPTIPALLDLPNAYLRRTGRLPAEPCDRLVAADPQTLVWALTEGYAPLCRIAPDHAPTRPRILLRRPDFTARRPLAREGDILILLMQISTARLYEWLLSPAAAMIGDVRALSDRHLLGELLDMVKGAEINIERLVRSAAVSSATLDAEHPMDGFFAFCRDLPPSRMDCLTLLMRVPGAYAKPTLDSLAHDDLCPSEHIRVIGRARKDSRLSLRVASSLTVNLNADLIRTTLTTYLHTFTLPALRPQASAGTVKLYHAPVPPTATAGVCLSIAETKLPVPEDAFVIAINSVLSAIALPISRGNDRMTLSLSVRLHATQAVPDTGLLSAVCGLYRAAAELSLPLIAPVTDVDAASPSALSVCAAAPDCNRALPNRPVGTGHGLYLLVPDRLPNGIPNWDSVRTVLDRIKALTSDGSAVSITPITAADACPAIVLNRILTQGIGLITVPRLPDTLYAHTPVAFFVEAIRPIPGLLLGETVKDDRAERRAERRAAHHAVHIEEIPSDTSLLAVTSDPFAHKIMHHTKGNTAMKHIFEPLSKKPRAVILDTDIGPDCDDVGALVTLIHYAKEYGFPIAGICNCTSNKAGTGAIDAVCRHCGMDTPPLGQWSKPGFMDDPSCHKYNDAVAEKFSEAYCNGTLSVEDEVTFYRRRLAEAEDGGIMLISIGMFNDLAALLDSQPDDISPLSGRELVAAKVDCLVSMAAILPQGRECNVTSDYHSAQTVFEKWPTPIYLSDFHIGYALYSGYSHITAPADIESNPLVLSYHLYTKDWTHIPVGQNCSYDLTAVQFAALGEGEFYGLGEPGRLEFYAEVPDLPDATRFVPDENGNMRFMTKKAENEVIGNSLNRILHMWT